MDAKRIAALVAVIVVVFGAAIATTPNLLGDIRLGLDLKGGFEILYRAEPIEEGAELTQVALKEAALSLANRADALGIAEPEVVTEGRDRIRVSLAGVENEREVREIMKKPAELTFRSAYGCNDGSYCKVELHGSDFKENSAQVVTDELGRPVVVSIEVKEKKKFEEITRRLLGKPLAIFMDDELISEPIVQGVFSDGKAVITGQNSRQEAERLRDIINLGSLPLNLTELYTQKVGPSLGQLSLEKTLTGGLIGSALILLFIIFYYRLPGVVAAVSLIFYTWMLLVLFKWMDVTLTLPGIAAFVLGIGMAVDANVITAERIKEEIRSGKTILSSVKAGSRTSLRTIMDANLTTILAALMMFVVGRGSVRGFAVILIASILASIVTNVFFSRMLLSLCVRGFGNIGPSWFGVKKEQIRDIRDSGKHVVQSPFHFVGKSKWVFGINGLVIVAGLVIMLLFSMNYGVDFSAGTRVEATVGQAVTEAKIAEDLAGLGLPGAVITVGGEDGKTVSLRFKDHLSHDEEMVLTEYLATDNMEVNTVDPTIAQELKNRAVIAVLLACVLIVLYVSFRFEWRFAVSGVLALFMTALFIIGAFAILRIEVNLTFIVAVLTIIGYAINDTIVIFDRIRENLRFAKVKQAQDLLDLVNRSVWQTMGRSINTLLTTLFPALGILFIGSASLRPFSFAIVIGLIVGAFGSLFVAAPLWYAIRKRSVGRLAAAESNAKP
jgi:SecD/SecF fusion protein